MSSSTPSLLDVTVAAGLFTEALQVLPVTGGVPYHWLWWRWFLPLVYEYFSLHAGHLSLLLFLLLCEGDEACLCNFCACLCNFKWIKQLAFFAVSALCAALTASLSPPLDLTSSPPPPLSFSLIHSLHHHSPTTTPLHFLLLSTVAFTLPTPVVDSSAVSPLFRYSHSSPPPLSLLSSVHLSALLSSVMGNWECAACGRRCHHSKRACAACGGPRPSKAEAEQTAKKSQAKSTAKHREKLKDAGTPQQVTTLHYTTSCFPSSIALPLSPSPSPYPSCRTRGGGSVVRATS